MTFTATVTPSIATGSVQFLDGPTALGTAAISNGSAALSVASLAGGVHSIKAAYNGDTCCEAKPAMLTEAITPGAASNLSAAAISSTHINLNWSASSTSGVTYNVYAGAVSGFTPGKSNRVAAGINATTYSSGGLTPSSTHYYVVTAQNSAGESAPSNQAGATTQAAVSCHVGYDVSSQSNTAFTVGISITNTGIGAIDGWKLTWTWASNQQITNARNSTFAQLGADVTLSNAAGNKTIGPGATLNGVGFEASYSGANPAPSSYYANGTLCQ